MRRCYVGIIVDALGILQHGCRGHLFGTRRTGRQMFLLDPVYLVGRITRPAAVAGSSVATGTVRPHRSEVNTIRALMDLALPKFEGLGDRPPQVHEPWMVSNDSPAPPDPGCSTDLLRSPSPCLHLDALSSDNTEDSIELSNISVALICGSDDGYPC